MQPTRRTLVLSLAAGAALNACGGGGPLAGSRATGTIGGGTSSGGTGTGGGDDTISIQSYSPASIPATSSLPITVVINYQYDLESTTTGNVSAGYEATTGSFISGNAIQPVIAQGSGASQLSFQMPVAALTSDSLAIAVELLDPSNNVLASASVLVPRG